ncbi:MAG: NADH-quinone oxidoreductase subunit NuoG [Azoarcus sp.]|jgi:NADH-quinone oxidoreductase subunit G|nr:NADH-quinone oxidoreductase subunit NuoG [Azoarcus sp.]
MLDIEIDGKALKVPGGSTIMDAATLAGIYIPHFCYHKKLSIAASCRMCLVQVEKAPKPLPACATPVTNGMKVWTRSEAAVQAQKGVMEFLLINHPLDCPVCDQGGECQLQDLAVGYGGGQSRYREEKRVWVNKNLGPLVASDASRCINCTRCVRFTAEIGGQMELGQTFRGDHAEIMTFLGRAVESEISGNIIDLCPVGALTSKPFRFSARTWELSRRRSVSPHDSLGTNLIVQTRYDQVKRVLPLNNDQLNECWLSDKDRFSYEALSSEQRITLPMMREREGGDWHAVSWQIALEFITSSLRSIVSEQGGQAFGALASPHSTIEELYLLQKLTRALGSENIDFRLRRSDFRSDAARSGAFWLGMNVVDIHDLENILVIGSFLRKDAPLLAQKVRHSALRHGLQVCAVGPNAEDWRMPVDARALVAPSEMVPALAGIAAALAAETGQPVAEALAARVPAGEVSAQLRAIAKSLAGGKKNAVWLGNLAEQHPRAAELHLWAQEIARLSGASLGFIGEAANSTGAYLVNAVPGKDGLNARAMFDAPRHAYLLLGAEPDLDFADGVATMNAMAYAQLVVAATAFDSPALRQMADVLLPIAPFTETSGTFVNCIGDVQSFEAVARSRGEARPAWKVLRALGTLLELPGFGQNDSVSVRDEALGAGAGMEAEALRARLNNAIGDIPAMDEPARREGCLQRVADVPIHFADPLVRRAPSLQKTADAAPPVARMSAATLAALGVHSGETVRVTGTGAVELTAVADEGVAPGCIRVAAAHVSTVPLGPMSGELSVERI